MDSPTRIIVNYTRDSILHRDSLDIVFVAKIFGREIVIFVITASLIKKTDSVSHLRC